MKEKAFLKKHPGLEGKILGNRFKINVCRINEIHETQIDKQVIEKAIEKIQKFIEENDSKDSHGIKLSDFDKLCFVQADLTKLKKEFGLQITY